jgi:hypothetical protein
MSDAAATAAAAENRPAADVQCSNVWMQLARSNCCIVDKTQDGACHRAFSLKRL